MGLYVVKLALNGGAVCWGPTEIQKDKVTRSVSSGQAQTLFKPCVHLLGNIFFLFNKNEQVEWELLILKQRVKCSFFVLAVALSWCSPWAGLKDPKEEAESSWGICPLTVFCSLLCQFGMKLLGSVVCCRWNIKAALRLDWLRCEAQWDCSDFYN